MIPRGPALLIIGLTCVIAPGVARIMTAPAPGGEAPPTEVATQQRAAQACMDKSVQVSNVWVGCKATQIAREQAKGPSRLRMNSQSQAQRHKSGARFVSLQAKQ